jgi:hypothetical protein
VKRKTKAVSLKSYTDTYDCKPFKLNTHSHETKSHRRLRSLRSPFEYQLNIRSEQLTQISEISQ